MHAGLRHLRLHLHNACLHFFVYPLQALQTIHRHGVAHGDVRADNILLQDCGNNPWVGTQAIALLTALTGRQLAGADGFGLLLHTAEVLFGSSLATFTGL